MANTDILTQAPPSDGKSKRPLIYKQFLSTRLTHWIWAISLFFLLTSGLMIFNAHPALYIGDQSGFGFDNAVLRIGAERTADARNIGFIQLFDTKFETTGWFGFYRGDNGMMQQRAFPPWATIPSYYDLASGRVVHFFFAWIFAITLAAWLVASIVNGHLRRDILPGLRDIRALPRDIADHLRLRFHHSRNYNTLQKLSYAGVLLVLMPLMVLTGLAMSPGFNAAAPWLVDILGGRQTARTIHFAVMLLLVGFFVIHIVMVLAAGPLNELRSIITGWYRADAEEEKGQ